MKKNKEFLQFQIFGGNVDDLLSQASQHLATNDNSCKILACINPHSVATSANDGLFKQALLETDWLIADGVGVSALANLLPGEKITRISGPDAFLQLMDLANKQNLRVFFLGSSEITLNKISQQISKKFGNIKCVEYFSPSFKPSFSRKENDKIISIINNFSPDILWVGMTAPKQEKWLHEHKHLLNVKVAGAIGAAFDYFAEPHSRPPRVVRSIGLEWFSRLLQNPKKMWRRTFVSFPKYLFMLTTFYVLREHKRD